jgi:branched-chain amino acid transport system permease protein
MRSFASLRTTTTDSGRANVDYLLLQVLNGVQLGLLMFLLAAGLTLTFGIMDLVNLAHGSLYMMGAYIAWTLIGWTDSFVLGALLALPATFLLGIAVEAVVMRRLYARDHLDQVLATFGLILFFNELVRAVWGPAGKSISVPGFLARTVEILPGMPYPAYRFAIIVAGAAVAALLAWLVARTRLGMLIRAGASNRRMIGALGVNIELLFTLVFGLGAVFAGLAGLMAAPLSSVKIGMGDDILIVAFVIIVIGGIGSIKGAFVAAMVVGQIDIIGRAFLPDFLKTFLSTSAASSAAPAISQVLIYIVMAGVLVWRPTGLFGQRS